MTGTRESESAQRERERAHTADRALGSDGSGSIPTDELVGIIQNNGKRMRQDEIDDFRVECDPQNSGRCNYQQFIQVLMAGLNSR